MKKLLTIMTAVLSIVGLWSCGSDSGEDGPITPPVSLQQTGCSITDGQEVDPKSVTEITIQYNTSVTINPAANVTLNSTKVEVKPGASSTAIRIAVSLDQAQTYTLNVPEGTVYATTDSKAQSKAFKVTFTTKKDIRTDFLPDNEAVAMTRALGWGWNLGNHFDTSSGEDGKKSQWGYWDGAMPTEALYQNLAKMGAKSVRMPVTWGNYQGAAPDYAIEAAYMAEVEQNVKWALDAGLYVVLNTHHDEYWQDIISAVANSATNTKIEQRIVKTWTQIANRFKDCGDHLIFETFNEIHDEQWGWKGGYNYKPVYALLNEWNKVAVDAIRATGGNNAQRWIGIPGFCANPMFTYDNVTIPNGDKRIMIAVHSYDPFNFCTEGTVQRWGHNYKKNDSDEKAIDDMMQKLFDKYISKNIPCYIGEYGVVKRKAADDEKYRLYYLEYFTRSAYFHGIPVMVWDNNNPGPDGETFYYINHRDGSFCNESLVRVMIKAATSNDSSYDLKYIYNKAP